VIQIGAMHWGLVGRFLSDFGTALQARSRLVGIAAALGLVVVASLGVASYAVGASSSRERATARALLTAASPRPAVTSGWSVQRLPVPRGAFPTPMSCSSWASCTAVAVYYPTDNSNPDFLFALRWNGHRWSSRRIPRGPAGATSAGISSVSCPSRLSCVAVGDFTTADPQRGPFVPLAERWNGAQWSVDPVPTPAGPYTRSTLSSVSCTSRSACTAVGESYWYPPFATSAAESPLVERWNGTAWSIEPSGGGGPLTGVSCTSAVSCTATGQAGNEPFGERWDGTSWLVEATHQPPLREPDGANELDAISCTSSASCTAVGQSYWGALYGYDNLTLVERWNGSSWLVQPNPNPSPITVNELWGVSCASAKSCTAVGDFGDRSGDGMLPLVERWNGAHWSVIPTPRSLVARQPGQWPSSSLHSIACFSRRGCIAAGSDEGRALAAEFR
jgi:hypothetical protein